MKHHGSDDYLKAAQKHGMKVECGKGDHFKVYAPDGSMMVVPRRKQLATGTEHSILKFFIKFGIVISTIIWAVWRFQ